MFKNTTLTKKLEQCLAVFIGLFLFANTSFANRVCTRGNCVDGIGTMLKSDVHVDGSVTEFKYEGEFKNKLPNGQGKMTYPNGDVCEGQFKDGGLDGMATVTYGTHGKSPYKFFTGEWKKNQRNGQGTMIYTNGDKYEGEWKNSKREGQGVLTKSDGTEQDGKWKDDKFLGE